MPKLLTVSRGASFRDAPPHFVQPLAHFVQQKPGENLHLMVELPRALAAQVMLGGCLAVIGVGGGPGSRRVGVAHLQASTDVRAVEEIVSRMLAHTGASPRVLVAGMPPVNTVAGRTELFVRLSKALRAKGVTIAQEDVVRHYERNGRFFVHVEPSGRTFVHLVPDAVKK